MTEQKNDITPPPQKLLWVDLEMTGLDVERDRILELACIVTDAQLKPLDTFEAIICQPDELLDTMNEWSQLHHGESGLTDRVRSEGESEDIVQQQFTTFITKHFGEEPAILAGNSIHNDRRFIQRWWPDVDATLHYRMIDVSSWKIIMNTHGIYFPKQKAHRALDDIQKSIEELQYYLEKGNFHAA
jgi:oligoribonuclease